MIVSIVPESLVKSPKLSEVLVDMASLPVAAYTAYVCLVHKLRLPLTKPVK